MAECLCPQTDEMGYPICKVHVGCDSNCRALRDPKTVDEYEAALEHWELHGWVGGCSHGC